MPRQLLNLVIFIETIKGRGGGGGGKKKKREREDKDGV